jgi:hypothetical protein
MEDGVCQFQKFGYCKFKEECKRKHLAQVCENLSGCINKKHCEKRHPKNCKKYASEVGCRHGKDCAYNHHETKQVEESNELKEKIMILEKKVAEMIKETSRLEKLDTVVKALIRKVLTLENEIEEIKTKEYDSEDENMYNIKGIEEHEVKENNKEMETSEIVYENPVQVDKTKLDEVQDTKELENEDILSGNIKLPKKNTSRKDFKCEKCDYVCKKQTTMNKHVNTKHIDQKCKICEKEFSTSLELIQHVAKEHHKEQRVE